jgi:hypothetical protein
MNRKLNGYKQQDLKNKIYSLKHFVTKEQVEALLGLCALKCHYCLKPMLLEYEKRSMDQWTLDRIDNTMGHNNGNVLVCCLGCNLKRRNRPSEKFKFTQQLNVVKLG